MLNTTGLFAYQIPHVDRILSSLKRHGTCLDASDTGVGKTACALAAFRELGITPLVVGPLAVKASWERMAAHLGMEVDFVNYERARGRRKRAVGGDKILNSQSEYGREKPWGEGSFWEWKYNFAAIVFDEVHNCGALQSTLNSKLLIAARRQAQYVLCLSATAADSPLGFRALGYTLGLHDLKGWNNWILKHGCKPGIWGGYTLDPNPAAQSRAMLQVHNAIFGVGKGARLRKREIAGFPECKTDRMPMEVFENANELVEEIANIYRERPSDIADLHRVRQALELLRTDRTVDLVSQYAETSKCVVFVNYLESAQKLADGIHDTGLRVGTITGEALEGFDPDRQKTVDAFQRNKLDAVVCTYGAGGVGISLHDPTGVEERTAFLYPTYSVRRFAQALGRVHRAGGAFAQQFFIYFLGTLEDDISQILMQKYLNVSMLNDAELNGVFGRNK